MVAETASVDPYVGPRPFGRTAEDQARFFGRDRETGEIVSLVLSHAVLLVYAQSGAGKTSLFEAQVAPTLERKGFEVLPLARVRAAIPDDVEPASVRNIYASSALLSIAPDEDQGTLLRSSLKRFLRRRATPRCLVFDQFEEIFTDESVFGLRPTRWQGEQKAFFRQVAAALTVDPLLRVVFVIRKEHLAEVDRFATFSPEGLRTRFHLEPLSREAALAAIRRPVEEHTRRSFAKGAAEKLVDELLLMRVDVGGDVKEVSGRYVEPLHLQLVCESLWRDLPPEETVIKKNDVQAYGDIDQVLGELYDTAVRSASATAHMREGRLRKLIESDFITPSGTRAPVFVDDMSDGKGSAKAVAELERRRVIRAEEWKPGARLYELTHDRLIEPIRTSNETYRAGRRWRWWLAAALPIAALAGGIAAAVFFVFFTGSGGGTFDLIQYAGLPPGQAPAALSSASFSPKGNLVITAGADGKARVWDWTLSTPDLLHVLDASPKPLSSASFSPAGNFTTNPPTNRDFVVTAGADGVARVWKSPEYELKAELSADASSPLTSASFSPDGTFVVTAGADGVARVWEWRETTKPPFVLKASRKALSSASFSADGKFVVTGGSDGVARVWDWPLSELKKALAAPEPTPLSSASFSPNGKLVVTGGADGVARVWRWTAKEPLKAVTLPAAVTSTAFNSLGQFVLTAGEDGAARIWTWGSDKDPVRVAQQPAALSSAAFSPASALVLTADRSGFAAIYGPNQVGS
jgi:WD40 repeat protein